MLIQKIIVGEFLTHIVQNNIYSGCPGKFNSRNIITIIPNYYDLINELVICERSNIDAHFHINALLRKRQSEILVRQSINGQRTIAQLLHRSISQRINRIFRIKLS